MKDIICPNCHKAFKVDETGYSNILKQVHDHEFENKLNQSLMKVEKDQNSKLELTKKDAENTIQALQASKEIEIERLLSQIKEKENSVQSSVSEAVREIERERDSFKNDLVNAKLVKEHSLKIYLKINMKLK